jgi:hypothetical protein
LALTFSDRPGRGITDSSCCLLKRRSADVRCSGIAGAANVNRVTEFGAFHVFPLTNPG